MAIQQLPPETLNALKFVTRRMASLELQVRGLARQSGAAFISVESGDGSMVVYDDDGNEVSIIDDSGFNQVSNRGPVQPTPPDVVGVYDGLVISYDGTFVDGDWDDNLVDHVEIHATAASGDPLDDTTQIGVFTSSNGGVFNYPWHTIDGARFIALVAVLTDGSEGPASDYVIGIPDVDAPTDGQAPATAPTVVLRGGIQSIIAKWDPVANPDPVSYKIYIKVGSAPSLVGTTDLHSVTPATSVVVNRTPAGVAIAQTDVVHIRVLASDSDGDGPASADASTSPIQVNTADIANAAIQTAQILDGAVSTLKVANLAITNSQIALATISAAQVANDTLTATQIATDAITATEIANDAVTTPKLIANAVTAAKITADTITANEIAANAITTTELASLAVTAGKIVSDTITATQIAANAITTSELNALAVTAGKIVTNTITATQIAVGTITTTEIAALTIIAGDIAANTITAGQIAATTITASQIAATTITASQIAGGTITATQIASGTITATQIAGGTITAGLLSATAIDGKTITGATFKTAINLGDVGVVGVSIALAGSPGALSFFTGGGVGETAGFITPDNAAQSWGSASSHGLAVRFSSPGIASLGVLPASARLVATNDLSDPPVFQIDSGTLLYQKGAGVGFANILEAATTFAKAVSITTGGLTVAAGGITTTGGYSLGGSGAINGAMTNNGGITISGANNTIRISGAPTTTVAANVRMNSSGDILITTSLASQKIKKETITLDDAKGVLDLNPISWFDKSEWVANKRKPDGLVRVAGVTAEDVEEHAPVLASYNDEGELNGVDYDRGWVLLIPHLRDHRDRLEALERKIAALV